MKRATIAITALLATLLIARPSVFAQSSYGDQGMGGEQATPVPGPNGDEQPEAAPDGPSDDNPQADQDQNSDSDQGDNDSDSNSDQGDDMNSDAQ
jgi:hypothetical protein